MAQPGTSPTDGILQTVHDNRTQTLADLIEHNHATYGLLYNTVMHNHTQHILLASYVLGSDADALQRLYAAETSHADLLPWGERPTGRVQTEADLVAHLGDLTHERDFVDYFQKAPAQHGGWQNALRYYLFESSTPLLTGLVGGYAHPWLMLADAVELGSGTLAMDALALVAVDYSGLSKLLEVPLEDHLNNRPDNGTSPAALLDAIRSDAAFDGVVQHIGIQSAAVVLANQGAREAVVAYLARFALTYSSFMKEDSLDALLTQFVNLALDLLATTSVPGIPPAFDFFLNHVLSFCNCVRILLPVATEEQHKDMLFRMLWLMTLLPYITQQRPTMTLGLLDVEERTLSWDTIQRAAVDGQNERATDPHFVKMVQLLSAVPTHWPALADKALRVANRAVRTFTGWRGFGAPGEAPLNTKEYRDSMVKE